MEDGKMRHGMTKNEEKIQRRIVICDDEKECREQCHKMVENYFLAHGHGVEIIDCASAEELMEIEQELYIIFLDIELPVLSGIAAKDRLSKIQPKAAIVFITNYPDYMPRAFGKNVYRFIKKPPKEEEVFYIIDNIERAVIFKDDYIVAEKKRIVLSQVLYVEADDKYVRFIFFAEDPIMVRGTLRGWEEALADKGFCRSHKSYLVNLGWVRSVNHKLELRNNETVPMSKTLKQKFIEAYTEYVDKRSF